MAKICIGNTVIKSNDKVTNIHSNLFTEYGRKKINEIVSGCSVLSTRFNLLEESGRLSHYVALEEASILKGVLAAQSARSTTVQPDGQFL